VDEIHTEHANLDNFGGCGQSLAIRSMVRDGKSTAIFHYGPSGTGKSTLSSRLLDGAITQVFEETMRASSDGWHFDKLMVVIEIYQGEVKDRLSGFLPSTAHDAIRVKALPHCVNVHLQSSQHAETVLAKARAKRVTEWTQCNDNSSRSHMIYILRLVASHSLRGQKHVADLTVADLAGVESIESAGTGSNNKRKAETCAIQKELLAFTQVCKARWGGRRQPQPVHVPYSASALTRLLEPSISHNSRQLLVLHISPDEKLSTTRAVLDLAKNSKPGSTSH